jgi:hypothetical protein
MSAEPQTVIRGRVLPAEYRYLVGEPGDCHANATRASGYGLLYQAGLARQPGRVWCGHAWLADEDGGIVDVTPPWTETANEYVLGDWELRDGG